MSQAANIPLAGSGAPPAAGLIPRRHLAGAEKAFDIEARRWGKRILIIASLLSAAGMAVGFVNAVIGLTALGFVLALGGVYHRAIGLYGVGILCVVDVMARVFVFSAFGLPYNTMNYVLLLAIILSYRDLVGYWNLHMTLALGFVAVLFGWVWLAPSAAHESGLNSTLNVFIYFGLVAYFGRSSGNAEVLYWLGLLCGSIGALGGLVYYLRESEIQVWMNYNAWAYYPMTAAFGVALALFANRRRQTGVIRLLGLGVINLVWVFLSTSRGTTLVAIIVFLFFVVVTGRVTQKVGLVAIVILSIPIALALFPDLNDRMGERFDKLFDPNEDLTARTSGRSDLMAGAWLIFTRSPLGVGTGGFPYAWKGLSPRDRSSGFAEGQRKAAHSGWFQVLAETGVVGTTMLAAFVLSFVYAGVRKRRQRLLSLGLLVSGVFAVALVSTEFVAKGLWFIAAGATVMLNLPSDALLRSRLFRTSRSRNRGGLPRSPNGALAR
jgi:O-antigen ligase